MNMPGINGLHVAPFTLIMSNAVYVRLLIIDFFCIVFLLNAHFEDINPNRPYGQRSFDVQKVQKESGQGVIARRHLSELYFSHTLLKNNQPNQLQDCMVPK